MLVSIVGVLALFLFQDANSVGGYFGPNILPGPGGVGTGAGNVNGNRGPMGNVTFEATGEKSYDTAPRWLRVPAPRTVGSVFPTRALEQGRSGSAVIRCTLTSESALSGCQVVSEAPAAQGFGLAALTLAPELDLRPATKSGRAVASEVTLTAHFIAPPPAVGTYKAGGDLIGLQRYLTYPVWERAPSYSQVAAAYPSRAREARKSGRVSLDCVLADDGLFDTCLVMNEEPAGYGFGAAAVELARSFRTAPTLPNGKSVQGGVVKLPFTFSTAMLSAGPLASGSPMLTSVPSNKELAAAFPRAARTAGIGQTRSALECTVAANGSLTNCKVVSEAPAGYNVAVGAMQLAPRYRVSQWSSDGLPVVGSRVRVPISYNLAAR